MLKTNYDLSLSTITPLHIGSGESLERNFDYTVHDRQTWVIDQEALAEHLYDSEDDGRLQQMLQAVPPGQLLQPADYGNSAFFRYTMRGVPLGQGTGTAVAAHIKTVHDQPYIPGSSLKGALRSLIVRQAFQESGQRLSPNQLNNSRYWAGQRLERELLGRDPNHDLLRALHVADSDPIGADNLILLNAQVFGRYKAGAPIPLECVRGDAVFHGRLALDNYLFDDPQAQRQLRLGNRREWLTNLAAIANEQAQARIRQEQSFYEARPNSRAAGFYRQLAGLSQKVPADSFLLQVGWGGGWDSKTLGPMLNGNEREALIGRYRLARGQRQPGQPFPKSRRAIARGRGEEAQPAAPLGWLLVEMKERTA